MRECDRVIYDRPIPPRLLADLEKGTVARASDYAVVQWGDSDRYLVHRGDGLGDQPKSERDLVDANDWDGPFNSLKSALSWVEECERADAWGSADEDPEVQLPEPAFLEMDGPMEPLPAPEPAKSAGYWYPFNGVAYWVETGPATESEARRGNA